MTGDPHNAAAQAAALVAVARHLEMFAESMAEEEIWEDNPELLEHEAETAQQLARAVANNAAQAMRLAAEQRTTQGIPPRGPSNA